VTDQARQELVHGISSLIGRPTNLGRTATDHPHIKHKTATMTLDNYGHLYPDELDEVAQQMGAECVYPVRTGELGKVG
jgi:hypothetical protein